jgi:hypothetical protein
MYIYIYIHTTCRYSPLMQFEQGCRGRGSNPESCLVPSLVEALHLPHFAKWEVDPSALVDELVRLALVHLGLLHGLLELLGSL